VINNNADKRREEETLVMVLVEEADSMADTEDLMLSSYV
jgi:hypothetical protein